ASARSQSGSCRACANRHQRMTKRTRIGPVSSRISQRLNMPKKPSRPPQGPPTWPKHLAVRRLKEALEKIPALEGLNHLDPAFEAWHEDLSRILKANWPSEYLPNFWDMRITPFGGGPVLSESDLATYKQDMLRTKTRIELILRNEREIAEAEGNAIVTEI